LNPLASVTGQPPELKWSK